MIEYYALKTQLAALAILVIAWMIYIIGAKRLSIWIAKTGAFVLLNAILIYIFDKIDGFGIDQLASMFVAEAFLIISYLVDKFLGHLELFSKLKKAYILIALGLSIPLLKWLVPAIYIIMILK